VSACWAVVVAGGTGVRLGQDRPKAFVPLAGKPILTWSIRALALHPAVTDLLAVVPRGWAAETERAILGPLRAALPRGTGRIHRAVIGGARRQDSVRAGLEAAAHLSRGTDLDRIAVLIHDAARPIIAAGLIDALLACLHRADQPQAAPSATAPADDASRLVLGGAVPVVPVGDTLKAVAGQVTSTVDRAGLWRVQTPQAFPLGPVLQAHSEAHATGREVTDDAMLFESRGWPVAVTAGSALGIKITFPEDLALLEGWLGGPGAWYDKMSGGSRPRAAGVRGRGARRARSGRKTRRSA
jgi:2-C-methyl-D-erythritol 4-phosphate cytidylyltransferase / 2-C-methyl-D-erythritol 2,4-cyclodiphosphate synthase